MSRWIEKFHRNEQGQRSQWLCRLLHIPLGRPVRTRPSPVAQRPGEAFRLEPIEDASGGRGGRRRGGRRRGLFFGFVRSGGTTNPHARPTTSPALCAIGTVVVHVVVHPETTPPAAFTRLDRGGGTDRA